MFRPIVPALLAQAVACAALAQTPPSAAQAQKPSVFASCAECGVVRSVKRIETSPPVTEGEQKAPGLVASIPLGGGKPTVGSSTELRREQKPAAISYEIVVRLDDGRYQLVRQDDDHGLREGDKVRIERGKVVLRER